MTHQTNSKRVKMRELRDALKKMSPGYFVFIVLFYGVCFALSCIPLIPIIFFSHISGSFPILVGVGLALIVFLSGLSDSEHMRKIFPFSLFYFAPLPASLLGLAVISNWYGGPVDLKEFHVPATSASIFHSSVSNKDYIYISLGKAPHDEVGEFAGLIDAGMKNKIHPENFSSGVDVEPIGFAAGSRTKANFFDWIVDSRQILVKIKGSHGESVSIIIPAALFKSRLDFSKKHMHPSEISVMLPKSSH